MTTTNHEEEEVENIYERLEEVLDRTKGTDYVVIMGDWNAFFTRKSRFSTNNLLPIVCLVFNYAFRQFVRQVCFVRHPFYAPYRGKLDHLAKNN